MILSQIRTKLTFTMKGTTMKTTLTLLIATPLHRFAHAARRWSASLHARPPLPPNAPATTWPGSPMSGPCAAAGSRRTTSDNSPRPGPQTPPRSFRCAHTRRGSARASPAVSSLGPTHLEPRFLPSLSYPSCPQPMTTTTATTGGAWCDAYSASASSSFSVNSTSLQLDQNHSKLCGFYKQSVLPPAVPG